MQSENLTILHSVCRNLHLPLGEAQNMLMKQFEYNWDTLPDNRLDEMKLWFTNNWYRAFEVLEPEKHTTIMAMTSPEARQYQEWYNSQGEKGHKMMRDFKTEMWWIK
jgi:hypothetical protein